MKVNVCGIDRVSRLVSGIGLVAWAAVLGGPLWAWIGVIPLVTGTVGFCPIYWMIKTSTCNDCSEKS